MPYHSYLKAMIMKQTKFKLPCVVTIAGTDPSGGAGIQADIKTISATGSYAASVITVLVAQNTLNVQAIEEISVDFVQQQLDSVFSDLEVHAIKIGMLHDARIIEVIASALEKLKLQHVVFDPVMVAKSGVALLDLDTIERLKKRLVGAVSLITPNISEAEYLLGSVITSLFDMEVAAMRIAKQFNSNVLVKGGHLNGQQSSDVLYNLQTNKCHWFHAERIFTKNTHGTGCSLSSAIASYLAQDFSLYEAIDKGKQYLTHAIRSGAHYSIGHGYGPIDHFYFLENR
jgi:hydroxymethylpyrimidine/phosphomethylpyrimidine kinase